MAEEIKTELSDKKQSKPWLFKKGESGNPNGRPPGSISIVEALKRKLQEIEPENKKTYLELFVNSYFRKAIKDKDVQLMRDFVNRIDGMPKQEIKNENDGELIVKIVREVKQDESAGTA